MAEERFKVIPSVYLVLIKDNKILLSRRFNTGFCDGQYSFPAGHLDGEETLSRALIREVKEEIGIELDSKDLNLVHSMNRKMPNNERVDFFFTVKKWQGEPKNMETDKCDDLTWFELDKLPDNTIPYIKQAINCFRNKAIYSEWEES